MPHQKLAWLRKRFAVPCVCWICPSAGRRVPFAHNSAHHQHVSKTRWNSQQPPVAPGGLGTGRILKQCATGHGPPSEGRGRTVKRSAGPPPQTGHLGQAVGDGRSPTRATVFPRSTVKQISRSEMLPSAARRRGRGKHCATLTDHGLPRTIAFASTAKVPRPGYLLNTTADKQCRGVATRHRRIARTSAAFAC